MPFAPTLTRLDAGHAYGPPDLVHFGCMPVPAASATPMHLGPQASNYHHFDMHPAVTQIQAATKQDGASGTSLYLTLHVVQPRCGKEGLMSMLPTYQYPRPPKARALATVSSLKPARSIGQVRE